MKNCPFPQGLFPTDPLLCCRAGLFPSGAAGSHCLSLCDFRGARPTRFVGCTAIAVSCLSISSRLSRLSRVCLCQTFSPALKPLLHLFPKSLFYFSVCGLQQTRGCGQHPGFALPGAVSGCLHSSYSAPYAPLSHILLETLLPRAQPFGVLSPAPHFHGAREWD